MRIKQENMLRATAQRPASRQRSGLLWNRASVTPVALSQSSHHFTFLERMLAELVFGGVVCDLECVLLSLWVFKHPWVPTLLLL